MDYRGRSDLELSVAHTPEHQGNRYPRTHVDGYGYHHNCADLASFSWVDALIRDYLEWLPNEAQ
jgi:hypothetical protein